MAWKVDTVSSLYGVGQFAKEDLVGLQGSVFHREEMLYQTQFCLKSSFGRH
jgi:hypothetical protein